MKIFQILQDRSRFLFWRKKEAEIFVASCGATMGGDLSEAQILGSMWTKVEESLPCKSDDVLLFNGEDREIYLNYERGHFENYYKDITHWMPLPSPPQTMTEAEQIEEVRKGRT